MEINASSSYLTTALVRMHRGKPPLHSHFVQAKVKFLNAKFLAGALLFSLYSSPPAWAQHMNASDSPCKEVSVTSDLVECLGNALKVSDSKLNETYARVQATLTGIDEDLKNLAAAERAWIHFRDLTCDAEYKLYEGGSGGPPAKIACLEAQTRNRNNDLLATYGWRLSKFGK